MPVASNRTPRSRWLVRGATLAVLALLGELLVREFAPPTIRTDGIGPYMPLASIAFDGDLDLRNRVAQFDNSMRRRCFFAADRRLVDRFAVGSSMLWAVLALQLVGAVALETWQDF